MTLGLLGNKIGMTQIFDESGEIIPITVLKTGPCIITQIKTELKHGYEAIQVGYNFIPKQYLTQSELGHLKKSDVPALKHLKEFQVNDSGNFHIGQILSVNLFKPGQIINVTGKSNGKGFSGLQKKYKFTKGPMTHGSKNHKAPGSIGMGTTPGRVLPGKKMAGQLGNRKTTIKKLKVIDVNLSENILIVKGSVPGKPGNLITITISN